MEVAIVKYNAGNVYSVESALRRLGVEPLLTDDAEDLLHADCVLFPGQGEASSAMSYLRSHHLDEVILNLRQPVFGICIGQQLLCRHSAEGDTDCLGIFDTDVKRFEASSPSDKIPAMGWNELTGLSTPLFNGIPEGSFVYIQPFSAAIHKGNYYATQFHPEKSGKVGERILSNFLELAKDYKPLQQ